MFVPLLNAILFMFGFFLFMHTAARICNCFLLLFLYIIIVLSVRIFLTSKDVSWSVQLNVVLWHYFLKGDK